ncbi:MAG: lipase [Lachnospiraceae bacterium]|jgi:lysophospholipase L1-like esterase|nr:lipase [Lachnospiraceae bacterium]
MMIQLQKRHYIKIHKMGDHMIFDNLEFHNVMELQKIEGLAGVRLQRYPESVRNELGYKDLMKGRIVSQNSNGCEIRFVTDAKHIRLYLSSLDSDGEIIVYNGTFFHSIHTFKSGAVKAIDLEENERFDEILPEMLQGYAFSHKVWRIFMSKRSSVVYHGIDTYGYTRRPPLESEKPKLRWLAYGSSITQGLNATSHNKAYIQQAAMRLGVDVLNQGLSGTCYCEKAVADYIANRNDWDFVTLELGVNMRGPFTTEQFEARASYLIKTVADKHPDKPIFVITIYPNRAVYFKNEQDVFRVRNEEFIQKLHSICNELNRKNIHLIKGDTILTDFSALSSDLIHPSDYGHTIMGENLAKQIKDIMF